MALAFRTAAIEPAQVPAVGETTAGLGMTHPPAALADHVLRSARETETPLGPDGGDGRR